MATEPAYIIRRNILRYEGLLRSSDTTTVTRKTLGTLITEARENLHRAEIEETDR